MIGSAKPVYIGGIKYKSLFRASVATGISIVWLIQSLKKSEGKPVMIKGHIVILESWVKGERI